MVTSSKLHPESWDELLQERQRPGCKNCCRTLQALTLLRVPRCYSTQPRSSQSVIVSYIHFVTRPTKPWVPYHTFDLSIKTEIQVALALGKAKLALSHATTVPHLESCAALLAVEIAELIIGEMDMELATIAFHSDSRVVLSYKSNESRRFYVYVSDQVE